MYSYEYIWIDGYGNLRSKTKVLTQMVSDIQKLPEWNYDGSSTNQASGEDSEIILQPVKLVDDPWRGEKNYLVLCDTYLPNGEVTPSNTRFQALQIFNQYIDHKPMFGIEQEFFISKNGKVVGFENDSVNPIPQKDYYCGVGGMSITQRNIVEEAFQNCLKAGLSLTGLNAEVAPSQWEFQVCATGIDAADQLVLLRYITHRTLELHGLDMNIHPKPIKGDWNGSGCHVNFSTEKMREEGGLDHIIRSINCLGSHHVLCMENYGSHNKERLTGLHETSSFDTFSFGVANRGASVRIPRSTDKNKRGYFEDRRPSSNMDPYIVTALIMKCSQEN